MLNKNMANLLTACIPEDTSISSGRYGRKFKIKDFMGNEHPTYAEPNFAEGFAGNILLKLRQITTNKINLSVSSYSAVSTASFVLGSGDTKETIDDICLAIDPTMPASENNASTLIDDTNFSILSASCLVDNYTNTILSQTWKYEGTSEITIKEVGLFARTYNDSNYSGFTFVMFDRTVLDNPITVENGDTFTIALTIGGKATVTVNS